MKAPHEVSTYVFVHGPLHSTTKTRNYPRDIPNLS